LVVWFALVCLFSASGNAQLTEGVEVARFGRGQAVQIEWHPDGTRFLVSTLANELWVYDAEALQVVETVEDVRYFRFIEGTNYLRTWDAENKSVIRSLAALDDVLLASTSFYGVSPDGRWITVRTQQDTFEILDAETFEPAITDIPAELRYIWWRQDGLRFAVAGQDDLTVWDVQLGEIVTAFKPLYPFRYMVWDWSADGARLLHGIGNGSVEIWDAKTGQNLLSIEGTSVQSDDLYSATTRWLADGTRFMQCLHTSDADWMPCSIYESDTGELVGQHDGYPAFEISHNRKLIAWGAVGLLDASSGEILQPFDQEMNWGGQYLFWSPDSREIAFSNRDVSRLVIYNVEQREVRLDLKGHIGGRGVTNVTWSPDGQRILSLDGAGLMMMWDTVDGRMLHRIEDHVTRRVFSQAFESSAFDSANKRLLVATDSGKLEIWDLETRALRREIRGAGVGLYQIGWEPYGELIATTD
jgi:WD40 repeat protein